MDDAFGDAALRDFREVEASAEVLALAAQHDGPRLVRQVDEGGVDLRDERVVDRVALGRAGQAHMQLERCERRGQRLGRAALGGG